MAEMAAVGDSKVNEALFEGPFGATLEPYGVILEPFLEPF